MIKEKDLTIRIDMDLKQKIIKKAKKYGLSTSAFVRMIMKKNIETESE